MINICQGIYRDLCVRVLETSRPQLGTQIGTYNTICAKQWKKEFEPVRDGMWINIDITTISFFVPYSTPPFAALSYIQYLIFSNDVKLILRPSAITLSHDTLV